MPLHLACGKGCLETVDYLCSLEVINVNAINLAGRTPFHHTCRAGQTEVVQRLITHAGQLGIDLFTADWNGHTPLHSASIWGRTETVAYLLDVANQMQFDVLARDPSNRTPFMVACWHNNDVADTVKLYLDRAEEFKIDVHEKDSEFKTVLHMAATSGNVRAMVVLLDHFIAKGYNLNPIDKPEWDMTPIHYACLMKQTEIVQLLIQYREHGVDINAGCRYGSSLHIASHVANPETIKLLLDTVDLQDLEFCKVHKKVWNLTPLHSAILGGKIENVEVWLDFYIQNEASWTYNSASWFSKPAIEMPTLHYACSKGNVQIVKLLLDTAKKMNIDVNTKDYYGKTPIQYAEETNNQEVKNLMLEMHANGEIDVTPKVTFFECLFPSEPSFAHGFAFGACIGMGICIIAYKTKG